MHAPHVHVQTLDRRVTRRTVMAALHARVLPVDALQMPGERLLAGQALRAAADRAADGRRDRWLGGGRTCHASKQGIGTRRWWCDGCDCGCGGGVVVVDGQIDGGGDASERLAFARDDADRMVLLDLLHGVVRAVAGSGAGRR